MNENDGQAWGKTRVFGLSKPRFSLPGAILRDQPYINNGSGKQTTLCSIAQHVRVDMFVFPAWSTIFVQFW